MLSPKTLLMGAAVALAATAGTAAAAGSTTLQSPNDVKIEKAYAYFDSFKPSNRQLAVVVVKTRGQMPRRYDGLIRAGGSLGKSNGGSTGSVGGRASRCYTFSVPLKNGRLLENGKPGAKANAGSRHVVTFEAKGPDGKTVSSTKTVTLRNRKAGDRVGKPIGC
jgi:hypothetical protein